MIVGIFADTHDHLAHIRRAVEVFNERECELVLFAGDFVSTFAIPPLRRLRCPMVASFGDNEGNRLGIRGGMEIIGTIGDPPFCHRASDGTRFVLTHQRELLQGGEDGCDIVVYAHTHRARVHRDESGRLWINPGEASGWSYGEPTVAILDTTDGAVELVRLDQPSVSR